MTLTPAQLQALPDDQLIEKVALMMGWEKRYMTSLEKMSWCSKEIIDGKIFWSSKLLEEYESNLLKDWKSSEEIIQYLLSKGFFVNMNFSRGATLAHVYRGGNSTKSGVAEDDSSSRSLVVAALLATQK